MINCEKTTKMKVSEMIFGNISELLFSLKSNTHLSQTFFRKKPEKLENLAKNKGKLSFGALKKRRFLKVFSRLSQTPT